MRTIIDLYAAIERIENHLADKDELIKIYQRLYRAARGKSTERALLEMKIAYHVARRAELHAERDSLRSEVESLRKRGDA